MKRIVKNRPELLSAGDAESRRIVLDVAEGALDRLNAENRIRSIMHRNEESAASADNGTAPASQLSQWPVQIKLAPINASYFDGANLLIAADCTAYAYADFHNHFIRNRITLIGCPKLDAVDYTEKLTSIIAGNDIKSVTIVRMEVPCCGGLEYAAKEALKASGKFIPWQVVTVNIDGSLRK